MQIIWYDYIKPKYQDRAKLCYMDTDSFVIYIKTEDFYEDIAENVEKWFDTSNYSKDDNRPPPIDKHQKKHWFFQRLIWRKDYERICWTKPYTYLMVDDSEHEKAKGRKKCVIKRRLMFKIYKDCLFNDKITLKLQQRFKSDCHNVYTEQINKIVLSSNDVRDYKHLMKLQHIHMEQTHFELCKREMLSKI